MSNAPLDELDADALAMLEAYAAEERIPAAVHDRVWQRVQADVAPPGARWTRRGLMLGGLAVAAAVALLWMGGRALQAADPGASPSQAGYERATPARHGVAERDEPEPTSARTHERPQAPPRGSAPTSPTLEPHGAGPTVGKPGPAVNDPAAVVPEAREPRPSRKLDRRGAPSNSPASEPEPEPPEPVSTPGSTLAAETQLLAKARAALLHEHPSQALERLDEHARRFPSGVLAEERQALRAVALCEADRDTEGSAAARSFLKAHPHAALAQRVRSACLE